MAKASEWQEVKRALEQQPQPALLSLLKELYDLRRENRAFLQTRFLRAGNHIDYFKRRIAQALSPDPMSRKEVSLSSGRRAIRDYQRASADPAGLVDLMLYYVECGSEFASDFGYGESRFFASLEDVFGQALKQLVKLGEPQRAESLRRIQGILELASNVGWGYDDELRSQLNESGLGESEY